MVDKKSDKIPPKKGREDRLKDKLRANLQRRKQQKKARKPSD